MQKVKYSILNHSTLGSDYVINYKKTSDFSKVVSEITGGKGVDIILDPVSAQNYA
jgi:NADPH:quinone reductase-like Zn-dependent oxidoreductase